MSLITRNWIDRATIYRGGVAFLCCLFTPLFAYAVDVPANMIVVGTITASETVTPSQNDQVTIVEASTGKSQGVGTVLDGVGTYAVDLSKDTDFNGTIMSARIKHEGSTYQLLDGSAPVEFPFSGGLFPNRITLGLTIGEKISGSTPAASDVPADTGGDTASDTELTFDAQFDVNGDSKLNQQDVDAVKNVVAGGQQSSSADVNQDGIINTRDIIDVIRALNQHTRRY